jgi:hypothetical protein
MLNLHHPHRHRKDKDSQLLLVGSRLISRADETINRLKCFDSLRGGNHPAVVISGEISHR